MLKKNTFANNSEEKKKRKEHKKIRTSESYFFGNWTQLWWVNSMRLYIYDGKFSKLVADYGTH